MRIPRALLAVCPSMLVPIDCMQVIVLCGKWLERFVEQLAFPIVTAVVAGMGVDATSGIVEIGSRLGKLEGAVDAIGSRLDKLEEGHDKLTAAVDQKIDKLAAAMDQKIYKLSQQLGGEGIYNLCMLGLGGTALYMILKQR